MDITLFGTGYVGLVTGACLAEMGNRVLCVDVDAAKVAALQAGEVPIYEPGLPALVAANARHGRLRFTLDSAAGVAHGDVIFVAVGTPSDENGAADLAHVLGAAKTIGEHLDRTAVIVTKSTVPVGTAEHVQRTVAETLASRGKALRYAVVANPEFLKEGNAIADFMKPDRIVIGSDAAWAARIVERLYAPFNRNHDKILHMDLRSAEMTKYAANVMLAARVSLMNEFANLAERLGADVEAVRRGIGADPRIGYHFIYAGCGYGGSCFPKDVRALARMADDEGYDAALVRAVDAVNERQKQRLFEKLRRCLDGDLAGRTIALWGLAFKPNTDDMREAPSRMLMTALWRAGASVRAYDPQALPTARKLYGERPDLVLCETRDDALRDADALVVATEWNEFRSPDFAAVKAALARPVVVDGRNLYDGAALAEQGFVYDAIGRQGSFPPAQPLPHD